MIKRFTWLLLFLFTVACSTNSDEKTIPTATSTDPQVEENPVAVVNNADVQEEDEPVTIRFAIYDWDLIRYEALAEVFEEENPAIKIKLVSIDETLGLKPGGMGWPDDAYARLASAADVWSIGTSYEAVRQGLVLDLTPLVAAHNFDMNDFYPGALKQSRWDGGMWFLPTEITYDLIYFNKEAFDQAGLDYPQPGWTWDDFLITAKSLTVQDGDKVTQWGFVQPYPNPLPFVHAQAGSLFNLDTTPPTPRLEAPAIVEAVQWYTDLFLIHKVAPWNAPSDAGNRDGEVVFADGWQLIVDGSAAMWIDRSPSWSYWSQQLNVGVAPFPISTQRSETTPAYTNEFSISAGSKYPDAAWRWLMFLSQQPPSKISSGTLPSRPSVAEASGFWANLDEDLATTLRYDVDHAFWLPYIEGGGGGYSAFSDAITTILEGKESAADALAQAQKEAEVAIEEAQLKLAQEQIATTSPVVVAESQDEAIAAENTTMIQFMVADGLGNLQPYRDLARQFQVANPGIVVQLEQPNFSEGAVTLASLAANADCFQWLPDLNDGSDLATVLSPEPFIDADPSVNKEDFFPFALNQFAYQGQLRGLPGDVSVPVIEFNKDLFDAAHMDYPGPDWTTDDFFRMAVALTNGEGENKQYGFVSDVYEANDMLNMIQRRGVNLLNETIAPPATSLNDPATIEAMRWYTSLTTEYGVKPVFITTTSGSSSADFAERRGLIENGRAAMWTSSGFNGMGETSIDRNQPNVGVVPLPGSPSGIQRGGYQFTRGYFISANTQARQACWQWITFLTEQTSAISGLPARRDVAESPAFQQLVGTEKAAAYLASVEHSDQTPFLQNISGENAWLGVSTTWLITAYDQILKEGVSVEEALDNAQRLADEYRSCVMARNGYTDSEIQQSCLQEVTAALSQ